MNTIQVSGITISKRMTEAHNGSLVANILLFDNTHPTKQVFKVSLWEKDATVAESTLNDGDELVIRGMVYGIGENKHGQFIDIRNCKLIAINKIEKKVAFQAGNFDDAATLYAEEGVTDE